MSSGTRGRRLDVPSEDAPKNLVKSMIPRLEDFRNLRQHTLSPRSTLAWGVALQQLDTVEAVLHMRPQAAAHINEINE